MGVNTVICHAPALWGKGRVPLAGMATPARQADPGLAMAVQRQSDQVTLYCTKDRGASEGFSGAVCRALARGAWRTGGQAGLAELSREEHGGLHGGIDRSFSAAV
jgi:hypothetical protein